VIQALRRRLSYANVMATAAVFIALGGSSYAALRITGRDVVNRSLTNRDLKRNTLDGSRIKELRLGAVKRARNADRLNGVTAARLLVRCRDGTVPVSDVCIETAARAAAPYSTAAVICEGTDRRVDVLYITDDVGSVALTPNTDAGARAFRCVADPLN